MALYFLRERISNTHKINTMSMTREHRCKTIGSLECRMYQDASFKNEFDLIEVKGGGMNEQVHFLI